MAVECAQCGAQFDITLFAFGRKVRCSCGREVDAQTPHERSHVDEQMRVWLRRLNSPLTFKEIRARIARAKRRPNARMDEILRMIADPIDYAVHGNSEFMSLFLSFWESVPPS